MSEYESYRGEGIGHQLKPSPIAIPSQLMEAFRKLNAKPTLVGGAAVQVWTGQSDGLFQTGDMDFITHLNVGDFEKLNGFERQGRYLIVSGIAVEFPSGPLGVAGVYLDPQGDTVNVTTTTGEMIRCIRPEALLLDRLAQVVGWKHADAYVQALALLVVQGDQRGWDWSWLEEAAGNSRLTGALSFLREEWDSEDPAPENVENALKLDWDPIQEIP